VQLRLDESIGLKTGNASPLQIVSHFPDRFELHINGQNSIKAGQTIDTWLRPFEVAMWEISPQENAIRGEIPLQARELSLPNAGVESDRLELRAEPIAPWMEIPFDQPDQMYRSTVKRPTLAEFKELGMAKRVLAYRTKLPSFSTSHMLAFVLRFKKNGKWWRYRQPADIVQARAMIGDQLLLRFETVPNFRQTENNEWCPWLVFRLRSNPEWSGMDVIFTTSAYLPPEVEIQFEGWMVPQWWEPVLDI
jgi:hypothetical protein